MHWLYLFLAVIAETLGTTFLKMSNGFTQLFPSILAIALFCLALFLSAITLKYLAVGIVYAIWSGVGIVLVTLVGYFYFKTKSGYGCLNRHWTYNLRCLDNIHYVQDSIRVIANR